METVDRRQLLLARFQRQDLHRAPRELGPAEPALLDLGVQDTGPDGAPWALEVRGAAPADEDDLAYAWTLRGAPHAYRRSDLAAVAVATAALSEADAAKRVFDASKPLRAAGIPVLEALATVAEHQRDIVRRPTVKGELSTQLTARVDEPYLRWCRPCQATHLYEQPFRLAALQAGLELEAGTSPPVLRRIPGLRPNLLRRLGTEAEPRFDVVRNHLRFAPGLRRRDVVAALESTAKDVAARWPRDVVEVAVAGEDPGPRAEPRHVLAEDLDAVRAAAPTGALRLLGPYDPYLQLRDRELLVPDEARRKDLWRVLGRPGAVVEDGEVVGTWRAQTKGGRLTVTAEPWGRWPKARRAAVEDQAARLAAHRHLPLAAVTTP